ncbi:MAG: hypothetical protein ABL902_04855 [Gallionella sp.]
MHKLIIFVFTVLASTPVFAQDAHSPAELASEVQTLINSKNIDRIVQFVHPEVDPKSLEQIKASLASYIGAENLKVYIVAKDDNEAVRKLQSDTSLAGSITIKPLDERAKLMAERGWYYTIAPLGDLVVFGNKVGVKSSGARSIMQYGKSGDSYFITLSRKR